MGTPRTRSEDLKDYKTVGLKVIKLRAWNDGSKGEGAKGKAPIERNWRNSRTSERAVRKHVEGGGNAGVRLGREDLVIDVDPRNFVKDDDPMKRLAADIGLDTTTCPKVITGSGGYHLYLTKPEDVSIITTLEDYKGIDLKSYGFQVVAAGSLHKCGNTYDWDDFSPDLTKRPPAPRKLMALAKVPARGNDGSGSGVLDPEAISDCLSQIKVTDFQDNDSWLELMMACHHATGGLARQEFTDWSISDPMYSDQASMIGRRWDSLHRQDGKTVTVRTLFQAVLEADGVLPNETADACGFSDRGELTDDSDQGPETPLERMNKEHCVLDDGGKFRVVAFRQDPQTGFKYLVRHARHDFISHYENKMIAVPGKEEGDTKYLTLAEWWLKHPRRREAKGVLLDPCRDHPGWLNIWQGWAIKPRAGSWSGLQELIGEILVSGCQESYDFFFKWMAYSVQHADKAAEVACCFRGPKGLGKGTLGRALCNVFGTHSMHVTATSALTGRFNAYLRWTLFLFADEIEAPTSRADKGQMQGLITEPRLAFEGKGKDIVMGLNLLKVMMATNFDYAIPAGLKDERRYFMADCDDSILCDPNKARRFNLIDKQLYEQGGLQALLQDLLLYDLGSWTPRENIPQTDALLTQKLTNLGPVGRWWKQRLEEGFLPSLPDAEDWSGGKAIEVPRQLLQEDLLGFLKEEASYGEGGLASLLGRQLKTFCSAVKDVRRVVEGSGLRLDCQGRAMCYLLPELDVCRELFENAIGGKVNWALDD